MHKPVGRHGEGGTPKIRCAIYTRKSTEEGLEQEFKVSMPSAKPVRPTSSVSATRDGASCRTSTTMVGIRAGT